MYSAESTTTDATGDSFGQPVRMLILTFAVAHASVELSTLTVPGSGPPSFVTNKYASLASNHSASPRSVPLGVSDTCCKTALGDDVSYVYRGDASPKPPPFDEMSSVCCPYTSMAVGLLIDPGNTLTRVSSPCSSTFQICPPSLSVTYSTSSITATLCAIEPLATDCDVRSSSAMRLLLHRPIVATAFVMHAEPLTQSLCFFGGYADTAPYIRHVSTGSGCSPLMPRPSALIREPS